MADGMLVPVAQIAKIFGLTERRVQQLASDGIIPKADRGRYHFIEAVRGYIKFLQDRAFGKSENLADSHTERTRLIGAKANLAELEHLERVGELRRWEEIKRQDATLVAIITNNINSIPDRTSSILAAENDAVEIHDILSKEIRRSYEGIIAAMSETEVDDATLDIGRHDAAETFEHNQTEDIEVEENSSG